MIPPSTSHLRGSTPQGQANRLDASAKVAPLSLNPTQIVEAKVVGAEKISAVARAQLVANLQKQLANLAGNANNASTAPQTQQKHNLLQSLQLLRSPQLMLVKLQYQQLQQLTYTDRPVQTGQSIPVQLQADGRLTLAPNTAPTTEPSLKNALITQALRQALPQQQPQNTLFDQFRQLARQPQNQQLLPSNIASSLNKVAQSVKTPEQLSNPQQLKNALMNSGPLLEGKMAKQLSTNPLQATLSAPPIASDVKTLLAQSLKLTSASLGAAATPDTTKSQPSALTLSNSLSSGDIKLLLQQIIQNAQSQAPAQGQLSNKQQQTQLTLLLHQQLLSSMARVQVKQLQGLPQQTEQGLQPQPLQLEIPIRWGDHTHNLEVKIEQREDDDAKERGDHNKERKWQITLNFDLLEYGHFHAQLDIHGQHIKAKLWAENPETFSSAQAHLKELRTQLQEQGLLVDELNCQKGQPQQSSNRLSYQLVDIKT